jgi:glycosyltransferase involved in cell wall biosynthesis
MTKYTISELRSRILPMYRSLTVAARKRDCILSRDRKGAVFAKRCTKVLVVFNTVCLYGMERSVIETFEVLRPDVQPTFILNRANVRHRTPLLWEMQRSGMPFRFFHDAWDWPRFGMPRSFKQAIGLLAAVIGGNLDVLRAARNVDALYLPIVTSAYISVLAAVWFRLRRRKVIYFFHDLPVRYSAKLRPAVVLSTDLVHCAQRSFALAASVNPFVLGRRNSVIPPAIRLRQPGNIDGTHDPSRRNIVFIGQIAPHKGVDLLIDAFSALAAGHRDLLLWIAGGVYDENRAWFDASLRSSSHRDRIHHLGYRDDVPEILKRAYVLAIPTRPSLFQESFGRVAAEAMAAGVPCVCFKSGALEEVVVHRHTGLVCDTESAECLTANLEEFIRQPELRDRCGCNARLRYDQHYSEATVRRDWLQLLT